MAGMGDNRSAKAGGLPFVGNMSDGIDFVRKVWGLTGLPQLPTAAGITQFAQGLPQALPSMITPTLDIGELDKRIADLRAVEQWLNLNANMLRATIQSLEVQRNTIATLKSFGGSMLAGVGRGGAEPQAPADPSAYVQQAQARTAARHRAAAQAAAQAPQEVAAAVSMPAALDPEAALRPRSSARARRRTAKAAIPAAMPFSPAAWWGALQDQFARAAAAAAAAEAAPAAAKRGVTKRGADKRAKPAAGAARAGRKSR